MAAVQLLYGLDCRGQWPEVGAELDRYIERHFALLAPETDDEGRALAALLVRGAVDRRERIDRLLDRAATNWRVERMSRVDRNVLRVAVHELTERTDVPRAVVLDEAIEVAKHLGSDGSGAFVNGVLNRVLGLLGDS